MKINSYEIAYSEDELKDMVENKMRQIELSTVISRAIRGWRTVIRKLWNIWLRQQK